MLYFVSEALFKLDIKCFKHKFYLKNKIKNYIKYLNIS